MVCNHGVGSSNLPRSTIYPIDTPWLKRGESSLPWDRMFPRHVTRSIQFSRASVSLHVGTPPGGADAGRPTWFRPGGNFFGHDHRRVRAVSLTVRLAHPFWSRRKGSCIVMVLLLSWGTRETWSLTSPSVAPLQRPGKCQSFAANVCRRSAATWGNRVDHRPQSSHFPEGRFRSQCWSDNVGASTRSGVPVVRVHERCLDNSTNLASSTQYYWHRVGGEMVEVRPP